MTDVLIRPCHRTACFPWRRADRTGVLGYLRHDAFPSSRAQRRALLVRLWPHRWTWLACRHRVRTGAACAGHGGARRARGAPQARLPARARAHLRAVGRGRAEGAVGADRRPRRSGGDGEPYLAVAAVVGLKHLVPLAIIPSWCGARSTGAAMRHLPLDRHSGGITWLTSIR